MLLPSINVLEHIASSYAEIFFQLYGWNASLFDDSIFFLSPASQLFATVWWTLHCCRCPGSFLLLDDLYHVKFRTALLHVKNDTDGSPVFLSTLQCQACLFRPSCSSTVKFNDGDLVLTSDLDFCETRPEPFVAYVNLAPSLAAVFDTSTHTSADWTVYSFGESGRRFASIVQLELAALPYVKTVTSEDLRTVAKQTSLRYTTIFISSSSALAGYLPMPTAFSVACVPMTISLLFLSINLTSFRRQSQRFFKHPQRIFSNWHDRFLHIVPTLSDDDNDSILAFMYMTDGEILAIKGLAGEINARSDSETTSCVHALNSLYPGITQVYTSTT